MAWRRSPAYSSDSSTQRDRSGGQLADRITRQNARLRNWIA